jgi:choloylglycine hydrolase
LKTNLKSEPQNHKQKLEVQMVLQLKNQQINKMKNQIIRTYKLIILTILLTQNSLVKACTGITLQAQDGGVVVSRTVEWALSDAQHNKILIAPRKKKFVAQTPEGNNGKNWIGKYGFVSLTAYGQPYGPDGLNEKGLYVGVYYFSGFAEYAVYDSSQASQSMSVGDFMQWMLSSFETVDQVLDHLNKVKVVGVNNEQFGGADLPFHFKIADPSGKSKIIEIVQKGEMKIYEPYLGVITNSPPYDWHVLNQRNYLHLSTTPNTPKTFGDYELVANGAGSGLIGLPGDFTPPSRFVRAAAFTASCRPLATSFDAVLESFRILDNFNIPLGAHVPKKYLPKGVVSATQVSSSSDLKEKVYYYHTMWNREIRKIDLNKIDFSTIKEQIIDDDASKMNKIKDVTPTK